MAVSEPAFLHVQDAMIPRCLRSDISYARIFSSAWVLLLKGAPSTLCKPKPCPPLTRSNSRSKCFRSCLAGSCRKAAFLAAVLTGEAMHE